MVEDCKRAFKALRCNIDFNLVFFKKPLAALGLFMDSLNQPFLWPPIMSIHPSGEVIQEKSFFLQLQSVQTITGKRKNLNRLLIVNSLVFERGARP